MKHTELFRSQYGPWALIAGASEGLGAAYAQAIAARGLNLVLIARRQNLLKSLSEDLKKKYGIQVIIQAQDLSDLTLLKDFINSLQVEIGLLVYNAAFAPISLFQDLEEEQLLKITHVNVRAPLVLVKTLSDQMRARRRGGIILMSSLSGFQGSPKIAVYGASKAFNTILAEALWSEMKESGIDVLACCAGAVRTPGYSSARSTKEAPGTLDAEAVLIEALKSLGKRPMVIPGLANQFFHLILSRFLPVKTAINIMKSNTEELT
ncbi:MAG: SDR family NAD(P)-dependent oxidoreductase [Spirochaetaceae bacterium]|jgi:short-subunit dehydrogenase|nr:SDR family NAD(P)-dependent oxidoreductase [Spirochaetaceae bacterium]